MISHLKPVYIGPISWGLGDLIVSLPLVQRLIESGYETYLVARSGHLQEDLAPRISGLAGVVKEEALLSKTKQDSLCYLNLREHPLQKNYWWGSPEYFAKFGDDKINDLLATIGRDLGVTADFAKPIPLKAYPQKEFANAVAFIPGSDGTYKCWPTAYWLLLAKAVALVGKKIILLGEPQNSEAVRALMSSLAWVETRTLTDCLDVVSSTAGVVGVDTGITHMASQQQIPTVFLYRHRPVYWRPYAHCLKIEAAAPCAPECRALAQGSSNRDLTSFVDYTPEPWQCAAGAESTCMATLLPDQVIDAACKHLFGASKVSV